VIKACSLILKSRSGFSSPRGIHFAQAHPSGKASSGLNQFFSLRQPSVKISALVAQLLAFPLGCAWALRWHVIELDKRFDNLGGSSRPNRDVRHDCDQGMLLPLGCAWAKWIPLGLLNPDRDFNIKEHALITIMANVAIVPLEH
jgi:hypothetical protein